MPSTNPDRVRLVSPNGNSWVTVSADRAARLRGFGFRDVVDATPAPAPAPAKATPAKAPRKRAPRKAAS